LPADITVRLTASAKAAASVALSASPRRREPDITMALEKTEREAAQKNIAENRKAFHDYHILETFDAGMVLLGTEVKSIREGRVNLRDSFARIENGEVFVYNIHIQPYSHRGYADHDPMRQRKLLLHTHEIRKLIGKVLEKGMTLVPLRMYFKNGKVKLAIGLARGKQMHDKRETIKRREADRETRAAVKSRR
jgi:SsrA-binding protein